MLFTNYSWIMWNQNSMMWLPTSLNEHAHCMQMALRFLFHSAAAGGVLLEYP